jgi:hypothetical protein
MFIHHACVGTSYSWLKPSEPSAMNVGCSSYNKNDDGKTTRSTLANDSTATSSTTTTIRNKAF